MGLAERLEAYHGVLTDCQVSICQADLGLAERRLTPPSRAMPHAFQSARQIWVWPNSWWHFVGVAGRVVSICQADLGLAELRKTAMCGTLTASFNLPGRFGFGRTWVMRLTGKTFAMVSICQADLGLAERPTIISNIASIGLFQSARQIWVWPNHL